MNDVERLLLDALREWAKTPSPWSRGVGHYGQEGEDFTIMMYGVVYRITATATTEVKT